MTLLVIDRIQIGDRPPGVFGSRPRSHTVGWETFCDALRFETMGQTPDLALQRVEALYQLTLRLASRTRVFDLQQHQPPRAEENAYDRYVRAQQRATTAHNSAAVLIARPNDFDDDLKLATLQEFAAAYLMFRNSMPLSAVELSNPSGGADMDLLRNHEMGAAVAAQDELRDALWAHLDKRAVGLISTATVTAAQAPGVDATKGDEEVERASRVVDVVGDHLISMKAAYPTCYADAQLDDADSIADFLALVGEIPQNWIAPITTAIRNNGVPSLPDHPGRGQNLMIADTGKRFAVQFVTVPRGNNVVVSEMHVGGRPMGVFGTGSPGSHTTSWVVLCDSVRAKALGKTLTAARAALIAYGDAVRDPDQERVDALEDKAPYSLLLAQMEYDRAVDLADPVPELLQIQAIARAILMVLNAHPLSALYRGGLANAADEPAHRAAAQQANVAGNPLVGPARQTLREHMWGLFDHGTLGKVLDEDPILGDMPGAIDREDPADRGAYLIDHHLDVIEHAYPHAFDRAQFDHIDSVAWILNRTGAADAVAFEVCQGLDFAANQIAPFFPPSKKRKLGGAGGAPKKQKTAS